MTLGQLLLSFALKIAMFCYVKVNNTDKTEIIYKQTKKISSLLSQYETPEKKSNEQASVKCKLSSTPPSTGLSRIGHLNTKMVKFWI
jgi:hypothetical protein